MKQSFLVAIVLLSLTLAGWVRGQVSPEQDAAPPKRDMLDAYFADEVWAKVGAQSCLKCHKSGGDAEDSQFVLRDPKRSQGAAQAEALRHNREAFAQMARLKEGEQSRLLLKVVGKLEHGGEEVLKPDSAGYRVLAVLLPPKDIDDPLFAAKRRASQEQRRQLEAIAVRFAQTGFNLKSVFQDWILSDFYRADGLASAVENPQRLAPNTLATDKVKGIRVRPEHLHLALRELAGIEGHAFSKQFPLTVPESERLPNLWG